MQASILKKLVLVPHTPYTITDRAAFQSQLDLLRGQLIVEQQQEDILGHSDMAAPVFDHLGACCCAVSIVCSTARMDEFQGTYRRLLLRAAEDISKKMGYYGAWNWFPNGPDGAAHRKRRTLRVRPLYSAYCSTAGRALKTPSFPFGTRAPACRRP